MSRVSDVLDIRSWLSRSVWTQYLAETGRGRVVCMACGGLTPMPVPPPHTLWTWGHVRSIQHEKSCLVPLQLHAALAEQGLEL